MAIPVDAFFLYEAPGEFSQACARACEDRGLVRTFDPAYAVVAIAPLLTRKLARSEWEAPVHGTLIFHPSALPYRRGPDAIRWTVHAGERVSAATWFWCDNGLDTGPICEQEVVVLKPGESPGRAYHTRFVPAGLRALARALGGILAGQPRRVLQDETLATYEPRMDPNTRPPVPANGAPALGERDPGHPAWTPAEMLP